MSQITEHLSTQFVSHGPNYTDTSNSFHTHLPDLSQAQPTSFQNSIKPSSSSFDTSHIGTYSAHGHAIGWGLVPMQVPRTPSTYTSFPLSHFPIRENRSPNPSDNHVNTDYSFSHKRKATNELGEQRPVTRPRQTTTSLTDNSSQFSTGTGHPMAKALDIYAQPQLTTDVPYAYAKASQLNDIATDLWHFVFGSKQREEPTNLHLTNFQSGFPSKPKPSLYPFIGCVICGEAGKWTVWKNGNGCNKHIRRHLMKKHMERYSDEVKAKGLKNMNIACSSTSLSGMNRKTVDGSSTETRLEHRLAQCIMANTNILSVLECSEFRDCIQYALRKYGDLPSKLMLEEIIAHEASQSYARLKKDLTESLGHISFTLDCWVEGDRQGFMAVTVHWCAESPSGGLVVRSEFAALKYVRGSRFSDEFVKVVRNLGPSMIERIGYIVFGRVHDGVDILQEIHETLPPHIEWGGRRCFARMVNDATQRGLKGLWKHSTTEHRRRRNTACDANLKNIITKARDILNACQEVSSAKPIYKLHVELSQDLEAKWGSILLSIEHLFEMQPVLFSIAQHEGYRGDRLSEDDWAVLHHARDWLKIFSEIQSQLDFRSCETASHIISVCRNAIRKLSTVKDQNPIFTYAIECSLTEVEQFVRPNAYSVYVISMIINPTIKFTKFIEEEWYQGKLDIMKQTFLGLMLMKHQDTRLVAHANPRDSNDILGHIAASADYSEHENNYIVGTELERYLAIGTEVPTPTFDLLAYWKAHRKEYPHIYAVALDILPFQSVAISCERLLLSSEKTNALRNGQISFQTFENLQRLKYSSGKVRLQDTVWSHLNTFEPLSLSSTGTLQDLLAALVDTEVDFGSDSDSA